MSMRHLFIACFALAWSGLDSRHGRAADDPPAAPAKGVPPRLDHYGDPLPLRAIARMGTVRFRHGHHVMGAAFSPDGKSLASAGWDHSVRLWDLASGKQLRAFGPAKDKDNPFAPSRWACSLAFSPDGKTLACGEFAPSWPSHTIHLWDVASGRELRAFPGHQGGVAALAFSPDGMMLASGGAADSTVRVWPMNQPSFTLQGSQSTIASLAFSPDGKHLMSAGSELQLWEVASRRRVKRFTTEAKSSLISFWDTTAGIKRRQIRSKHDERVVNVALTPDGKTLASCAVGDSIRLWNVVTGKELHRFHVESRLNVSLAFSPDGNTLAAGGEDRVVHLWDVASGKERHLRGAHHHVVKSVQFSRDNRTLLSTSRDGTMRRWDALTGKQLEEIPAEHYQDAIALSADGRLLALGSAKGDIRIVNGNSGKEESKRFSHASAVLTMAFSRDGKTLAAGTDDSSLRRWDLVTGKGLPAFSYPAPVTCAVFAPDGKTIFSQTKGHAVYVSDGAKATARHWETPNSVPETLALSPDGTLLITGDFFGTVHVWDAATRQKRWTLPGHRGYIRSLAFSPDGRSLAAGSWRIIRVWEMSTGKERVHFQDFEGDAFALAFSPDKTLLASGGANSALLVWDVPGWRTHKTSPGMMSGKELDALLSRDDAAEAFRAIVRLAKNPTQALPLLKMLLKPVPAPNREVVNRLVRDLGSDEFQTRARATKELAKLGPLAFPALRQTLLGNSTLEVRRRIEIILRKLESPLTPEGLRVIRAVEALEWMDSAAARAFLATLAQGAPGARLTEEAKQAVGRQRP